MPVIAGIQLITAICLILNSVNHYCSCAHCYHIFLSIGLPDHHQALTQEERGGSEQVLTYY